MTSRRATVKKAQNGKKEYSEISLEPQDYVRRTASGLTRAATVPKNPYTGSRGAGWQNLVREAMFEAQPWVRASREELAKLKNMSQEDFERKVAKEEEDDRKTMEKLKQQRRGGKTALKKSATASRMKAKTGKKVVARKAVATKKAKTGARSYKRK